MRFLRKQKKSVFPPFLKCPVSSSAELTLNSLVQFLYHPVDSGWMRGIVQWPASQPGAPV